MLYNNQWRDIQDAIRKDASIAMRIDDSIDEDIWFDEVRRRKCIHKGFDISDYDEAYFNLCSSDTSTSMDVDDNPQMQLRYWVGNNQAQNVDENIQAERDLRQKRTLLHSLMRMNFPSNEALVTQLTHGDSEGLENLVGAAKTARMLIDASHNCLSYLDDNEAGSDEHMKTSDDGSECKSSGCNKCPCNFYRHYCPLVPKPPVGTRSDEESESMNKESCGMVSHTSVLTMEDSMGETPLHSLTGAGSNHIDLIKVIIASCHPLDEPREKDDNDDDERSPTVYDLMTSQNWTGCTPLHFLAGEYY